jgi:NAD(P)-dependent dehydrogenase (short-subunit alcohol dehydrogenase family)
MDLHGKVSLVTGGTMGIGAAIAIKLAQLGSDLAIVARNLGEEAEQTRREIEATGRRVLLFAGDMSRQEECAAAVERAASHFGRLDVLIHNAGGPAFGRIEDITPELWRQTLELHVSANFYLAKAALPHLRKQKEGAIVTISSTAGILGVPGAIAYATAKGALPQFTRSLARDLADDNIRVNGVAPGVIRTRFHADMTDERRELNLKNRIPLHREGTPEQVADVVAMLVTNDYITGETVVIDGGLTARIV